MKDFVHQISQKVDEENWFEDLPIKDKDTTDEEFLKELEEYKEKWRERLKENKNSIAKDLGLSNDDPLLNFHMQNIDKQTNELLDFYAKQGEFPSYLTDKNNGVVIPINLEDFISGIGGSVKYLYIAFKSRYVILNSAKILASKSYKDAVNYFKNYIKKGKLKPNYKGGKIYNNDGRGNTQMLPKYDKNGNPITYKEYDVHQKITGVNRSPERIVVGSDGKAYYTNDHYDTFVEIVEKGD